MERICNCGCDREIFLYLGGASKRYVPHRVDDYTVHYFYCYNCGKEFTIGEKNKPDCGLSREGSNVIDITRLPLLIPVNFYSLEEDDKRNLMAAIMAAKSNGKKDNILAGINDIVNVVTHYVSHKK